MWRDRTRDTGQHHVCSACGTARPDSDKYAAPARPPATHCAPPMHASQRHHIRRRFRLRRFRLRRFRLSRRGAAAAA
eukprot:4928607-Prymnesium_polylepis.1